MSTEMTTEHNPPAFPQRMIQTASDLSTQDNECTANPMFCVQIQTVESGFDEAYATYFCWWNAEQLECVYDDEPKGWEYNGDGSGWERFGYKLGWQTVMVAFTREGCEEYLELNGHNDRRRAHQGEVRIFVESFNRCPEMIAIREFLQSDAMLAARKEGM